MGEPTSIDRASGSPEGSYPMFTGANPAMDEAGP